jgi:hypothetical protein
MIEFTCVTLSPIRRDDWIFKVSAGDYIYGHGVLVVAFNRETCDTRIKYFSDDVTAKKWVDDLVNSSPTPTTN